MSKAAEKKHVIYDGLKYAIEFAVLDDDSIPAADFFRDHLSPSDKRKLRAYFEHFANTGEINNPRKFKHERKHFSAFKHKSESKQQVRLPCFQEGRRWIVTHGFFKGAQSEWDEAEFTRATEIRNEVLTRERKNNKNGQNAS